MPACFPAKHAEPATASMQEARDAIERSERCVSSACSSQARAARRCQPRKQSRFLAPDGRDMGGLESFLPGRDLEIPCCEMGGGFPCLRRHAASGAWFRLNRGGVIPTQAAANCCIVPGRSGSHCLGQGTQKAVGSRARAVPEDEPSGLQVTNRSDAVHKAVVFGTLVQKVAKNCFFLTLLICF